MGQPTGVVTPGCGVTTVGQRQAVASPSTRILRELTSIFYSKLITQASQSRLTKRDYLPLYYKIQVEETLNYF